MGRLLTLSIYDIINLFNMDKIDKFIIDLMEAGKKITGEEIGDIAIKYYKESIMEEKSKYYTPDISEFVQGFEFEKKVSNTYRYDMWIDGEFIEGKPETITNWYKEIVDWKHPNDELINYDGGDVSYTFDGATANFFSANDDETITKLLKDGKIRARK